MCHYSCYHSRPPHYRIFRDGSNIEQFGRNHEGSQFRHIWGQIHSLSDCIRRTLFKNCARAQSPQAPSVAALSRWVDTSCNEGTYLEVHTYPTHLPAKVMYDHYLSKGCSHKRHNEDILRPFLSLAQQVSHTHPHFGGIPGRHIFCSSQSLPSDDLKNEPSNYRPPNSLES